MSLKEKLGVMALAGAMVVGAVSYGKAGKNPGCAPGYTKQSNISELYVSRGECLHPDSIILDTLTAWTRFPTCCQKLEVREGYVQCLTDEGWTKQLGGIGEKLFVSSYRHDKDLVYFNDFDCDGHIDLIFNFDLDKLKIRFEPGTDELFKKADKLFLEYKDKLREGVDLELETKKWLDSRKETEKQGLLDNL